MKRAAACLVVWVVSASAPAAEPTVVQAGAEPRQPIRLALKKGTTAQATLSMEMAVSTEMMGMKTETKVPRVDARIDVSVPVVGATASDVAFSYRDITIAEGDAMGNMIAAPFKAALDGSRGTMKVSSRGELLDVTMDTMLKGGASGNSDGFDLSRWFVPFPEQAVGVGASWTVKEDVEGDQGLTIHTVTTYTLLSNEDGRVTVQVVGQADADPGKMKSQGMTVDVDKLQTRGKGVVVVRLDQPFAESGSWSVDVEMLVGMGGMKVPQTTHLDLKVGTPVAKAK